MSVVFRSNLDFARCAAPMDPIRIEPCPLIAPQDEKSNDDARLDETNGVPATQRSMQDPQGPANWIAPDWSRVSWRQTAVVILLLILALALRLSGLPIYPYPNQTADEYHYLWAGLSLLHEGKATSWSELQCYRTMPIPPRTVVSGPYIYRMVTPALDHPPLFSLVVGSFAQAMGARKVPVVQRDGATYPLWSVELGRVRLLSMILFCITFLLLFAVARHAFSFHAAATTLVFYGVILHVVVHNRLLVTENLTTPLFLLNIYYLQRYVAGRCSERAFVAVSIAATAAALLAKVVAVSQAPTIIVLLLLCGRRRETVYPILGILLGAALYALYGWWQGWDAFVTVLGTQAGRFDGFGELKRFVVRSAIVHDPNVNVLLSVGWFFLFAEILRRRESLLLAAAPLYILSLSYFASASAIYGWHALPLYPFVCMALAVGIGRVWRDTRMTGFLVLLCFFYFDALDIVFLERPQYRGFLRLVYLILTPVLILPPLIWPKTRERTVRFTILTLVLLALMRDIWENRFLT